MKTDLAISGKSLIAELDSAQKRQISVRIKREWHPAAEALSYAGNMRPDAPYPRLDAATGS
jgi:hypothetical protein